MTNLTKIKKSMFDNYYLKKIEGHNWYYGRFFELCVLFFFLVGLFLGLAMGRN